MTFDILLSGRNKISFSVALKVLLVFCVISMLSCASVNSLPQSAQDAEMNSDATARGYWPRQTSIDVLPGITISEAFAIAANALLKNNFSISKEDRSAGVIIGEHGMTLDYWNLVAGIYLKAQDDHVAIKVITVGSKDTGVINAFSDKWSRKILTSMHVEYYSRKKESE